ncbi:MAG TPA: SDR family NAD(P)-dependent oxidoreductase, partial [Candidatus Binatia bacterium]|nr:SDR family NAD(P)-dependent oxidoreductase [Candidatus Binatia bacterium]
MTEQERSQSLRGKVVLVTGASRGIGAAAARRLAAAGAAVVVNYHQNRERALEVLQEVENAGAAGMVFQADVTRKDQVEAMGQAVREKFSAIDVLVNNAYFPFEVGMLHELSWESLHRAIEHELAALYNCARVFLPGMIEK